jgi:xanthine dehydrogenase large subunit
VAEVGVDTLTGEYRLLRADLLHDVGAIAEPGPGHRPGRGRLHPGHGLADDGRTGLAPGHGGALLTHAPSTYKIPTANDVPAALHTQLFGRTQRADSIHRSKAVGEPPLLLAVLGVLGDPRRPGGLRGHRVEPELQCAPATPEAVLRAMHRGPGHP